MANRRSIHELLRNALSLHSQGKHHNAICSMVVTTGSFELADALGKRLGHTNNKARIVENITTNNALLRRLAKDGANDRR